MLNWGAVRSHFSKTPRYAAVASILIGLTIVLSQSAHRTNVFSQLINSAPMQFSTALCFLASGLALFLLTTSLRRLSPWLGASVVLVSLLTLFEYLTEFHLRFDLLFLNPIFEPADPFSGRMSPVSAAGFLILGLAIGLSGSNQKWSLRFELAGLLMGIVATMALVVLAGFIFGAASAYRLGAHSNMAVVSSVTFLILSVGLLTFAWQRTERANFVRWLPVVCATTLIAMVAIISASEITKLRAATFWRKHTMQTIVGALLVENNFVDIQRGMRGYVTLGDTNALASFQRASQSETIALPELTALTVDSPSQQKRLKELRADFDKLMTLDNQLIARSKIYGPAAAALLDSNQESRNIFGHAHAVVEEVARVEQELLDVRGSSEENDLHSAKFLLIFGCVLAIGLLLIASFLANNQLARRKRAEAKLLLQADALRRSNIELEQFAYVASHDMREPLRAITGFAQILKSQHAADPDDSDNQILGRIVDGAKRMSRIIDDLLMLSSINSPNQRFEKTSLQKPLQMAMENLSVAIKERDAIIRHDPLPSILIDSSQLALLFQNLIGNAIKFCPKRQPEIVITAKTEEGNACTLSLRDNGIGIDPKYFPKIFGIFQRLHSREEYPGTGIGLAICKKIVERHGGRIWLESAPGAGTTFHFTLSGCQTEKYHGQP